MHRNRHVSHKQAHRNLTPTPSKRAKNTHRLGERLRASPRTALLFFSTATRKWIRAIHSPRVRFIGLILANKLATLFIVTGILILFAPQIFRTLFDSPLPQPSRVTEVDSTRGLQEGSLFGPVRIADELLHLPIAAQPPTRILIPSVGIDVPVTESRLIRGYWEVSEVSASHGAGSAYPGTLGNTVIFAHAREGLFLPLRKVKKGNRIYILTNDRWHRYIVDSISTVAASETHVISQTRDETITVFTCTGFLDTKRLVVRAKADR